LETDERKKFEKGGVRGNVAAKADDQKNGRATMSLRVNLVVQVEQRSTL